MHTIIKKIQPRPGFMSPVNPDGKVWITETPNINRKTRNKMKYRASIPDKRISHLSFESFGWHTAWAETIEELIEDIKSFDVPYYSEPEFLSMLTQKDKNDPTDDRQVELHWDSRGTTITRGKITLHNMTAYTSL